MRQYLDVVRKVLETGTRKENRTGVDTLSTFNINYQVDLSEGFPLLTTKRISWKNIVIENLWFLSGKTDIGLLHKHGCHFWDAWADSRGRVPSAYGNFWRKFPVHDAEEGTFTAFDEDDLCTCGLQHGPRGWNDQIEWVLAELAHNPMSRRLVVSAWAPGNAQTSKLPPCHCLFVLNVQNRRDGQRTLNLHLTQRSCDIALGVPYNLAGYAFLLMLLARFSGLIPGVFAHTLVDAHVYTCKPDGSMVEYDHVPGLTEQLERGPRRLPSLWIDPSIRSLTDVEGLLKQDTEAVMDCFRLTGYEPHPPIKFKVAV